MAPTRAACNHCAPSHSYCARPTAGTQRSPRKAPRSRTTVSRGRPARSPRAGNPPAPRQPTGGRRPRTLTVRRPPVAPEAAENPRPRPAVRLLLPATCPPTGRTKRRRAEYVATRHQAPRVRTLSAGAAGTGSRCRAAGSDRQLASALPARCTTRNGPRIPSTGGRSSPSVARQLSCARRSAVARATRVIRST